MAAYSRKRRARRERERERERESDIKAKGRKEGRRKNLVGSKVHEECYTEH